MTLDSLKDRVVVVTGAARGAGRAQALAFAKEGAKVVIVDRTTSPREDMLMTDTIFSVAEKVEKLGTAALPVKCDLRNEQDIIALRDRVLETFGAADVIINNAGINFSAKTWEIPGERWDQVMAVNTKATFLVCKHFLPGMIERRSGSIINFSSPAGRGPCPGSALYSASKAAVDYFTLSLAEEVREFNIAVNSISPTGFIDTEGNRFAYGDDPDWSDTWEPAEHFALAVLWLAKQDAASFTSSLVYSRALISQYELCKKWCCSAIGRSPVVAGPLKVDWESNLTVKAWQMQKAR